MDGPNIRHGEFSEEEDIIICCLYANIGSRFISTFEYSLSSFSLSFFFVIINITEIIRFRSNSMWKDKELIIFV
ncbi:hypothetical protein Hanom_Chr02g00104411 [Helianthus anomalus]